MEAPDREHRDRARLSLESSVIVEAGAGTGKTTLLTDRILFLVLAGKKPARVEEVVALTFTEKAAGEIKLRLSERLAELVSRLSGGVLSDEAKERAERTLRELEGAFKTDRPTAHERARAALEDLDKAPIGTIHSFCAQLLRLYPVEAGVDPGFQVDDGRGFDELFASEWARWLDDELGERPPRRAAWLELLALVDLEDLEGLARELCSERLDAESAGRPDPAAAKELRALAKAAVALPEGKDKPKGGILESLKEIAARLEAAAAAAEASDPPLDAAEPVEPRKSTWPKPWAEDEDGAALYERLHAVALDASPRGEAAARRAARLLAPFASRLRREYARRGWVSFEGLLRRSRDLLRDHLRPREELKRRFVALLIDEFQDTDPLQGELLLYLSERPGKAAKTWKDVETAPGRLFVVGDPKQSIYRFRGADIAAYEGFLERLRAGGALACDLTANFRSLPGIVGPVNDAFSRIMKPIPGAQPAYKAILPGKIPKRPETEPAVRAVAVAEPPEGGDAALSQRTEAAWVAGWLAAHAALPGAPEGRRPLKDCAVLLRSSSALPAFLDAFKRAGIPYAVEIERHFYGAPEVGDLLNLLAALDDPEDRTALAGLLRSPLAAITDDSLLALSRARLLDYRKDLPPSALPPAERAAAEGLYRALRELRARAGRTPLGELVSDAIDRTRLLELGARAYHGQQTVSNLKKLARMAADASESRGASLKEFAAEAREAARESKREGESPLADERLEAVRVLTMHKSKGLEFPVVFAANLSAPTAAGTKPAVRFDWAAGRALLRAGKLASAGAALQEAREKDLERRESVRLLYVAMTRAKEKLYLLGRLKTGSGSLASHLAAASAWPSADREGTLPAEIVVAGKVVEPEPLKAPLLGHRADAEATAKAWAARAARRASCGAPRTRAPSAAIGEAPKRPAPPDEARPRREPHGAELGQICHLALQRWDFKSGGNAAAACAAARSLLERRAPGPRWDAAERDAAEVLKTFASSPVARELASAEILGRELPFAYAEGPTVVRGAADLVYRAGGKLVVADYKSERVDEKSAREARKRFAAQGKAYAEALKMAWGTDAEFRVIFLRRPDL